MSQPTFPHGIFLTNEKWAFLGLSIYQNSVGSHDFLTRLTRSVSAKEGRLVYTYLAALGQNALLPELTR